MRGVPNFRALGAGPRIKPLNCCPLINTYLSVDPYLDPDFWTNAYSTVRFQGLSSKIPLLINYPSEFYNESIVVYKITTIQETYFAYEDPINYGFSELIKNSIIQINNGEYLSISFRSRNIGSSDDYAELIIKNNINSTDIAYYTLELYAP